MGSRSKTMGWTRRRHASFHLLKDDEGGVNISTSSISTSVEKISRQDEIEIEKKLSLQDLYPTAGEETGLRQNDDGGIELTRSASRKIIAAGPIPPNPDIAEGQDPPPSKRNRTPGTSDLEGR